MAKQPNEIDLSGKEPPDAPATPKRGPGRPRGSTTRGRPSSQKEETAKAAFEDGAKQLAGAIEDRSPDFAMILKRDAAKMAAVVGHHAARFPALYRAVILLFGPGSLVYAVRAFGPTILHVRGYLADRREARRELEPEPDAPLV